MNNRQPAVLHGPKISEAEYQRRIVALHESLEASPKRNVARETRRAELDLTIDHKLGINFPHERREQLWEIQQRVESRRGLLVIRYLFERMLPGSVGRGATRLADFLIREYRQVLNEAELKEFFRDELESTDRTDSR